MSSKSLHSINGSKILNDFETKEFSENIKLFYVFNDKQNRSNLILVTNNDQTYTFGGNESGVLGFGLKTKIHRLTANKWLSNKLLVDIKTGFEHMIGRTADGQVFTWGANRCGVLGSGRRDDKLHKPKLNKYLKNIVDISTGFWHSLALTDDGRVYSWGDCTLGPSGLRSDYKNCILKPRLLDAFNGERVVAISCGAYHSLVLTESGLVYSWGNNECGQLGNGAEADTSYPQPIVQIGVKVVKISAGFDHSLILSKEGIIYSFGCNECGELGEGAGAVKKQYTANKLIHSERFVDIETENSYPFSAAVSESGVYYVWGLCGKRSQELVFEPKPKKSYNSFEELFVEELQITHKPIQGFQDYYKRRVSVQYIDKFEHIFENVDKFSTQFMQD